MAVSSARKPEAKEKLHQIWMAATKADANQAFDLFVATYQSKYPKATECLTKDCHVLLTLYDFPAKHWIRLRTTNPIESTFVTVRLRHRRTKGGGSRFACLTTVFKLMQSVSKKWLQLNGSQLLPDAEDWKPLTAQIRATITVLDEERAAGRLFLVHAPTILRNLHALFLTMSCRRRVRACAFVTRCGVSLSRSASGYFLSQALSLSAPSLRVQISRSVLALVLLHVDATEARLGTREWRYATRFCCRRGGERT